MWNDMIEQLSQRQEVKYKLKSGREKVLQRQLTPPQNILKAQVEEDYLKAGVGRSFF